MAAVPAVTDSATDGQASGLDQSLLGGEGLKAALSLDKLDLRQSEAIFVGPFEPGSLVLPPRTGRWVVCCGEFRDGKWTTLEQLPLEAEHPEIEIDADRATCLLLVCDPAGIEHWTTLLSGAMSRPEQIGRLLDPNVAQNCLVGRIGNPSTAE